MEAEQKSRDLPINDEWAKVLYDNARQYLAETTLQGSLVQLFGVPFVWFAYGAKWVEGILRRYKHVAFRVCERLVRVSLECNLSVGVDLLTERLRGIHEALLVYANGAAQRVITERSPEQEELFAALDVGSLAEQWGNRVLPS